MNWAATTDDDDEDYTYECFPDDDDPSFIPVCGDKQLFELARDEAIVTNCSPSANDKLVTFEFESGFKVSMKKDVRNAFDLLWDTFENDTATKVAQYYSGRYFVEPDLGAFGDTKNDFFGVSTTKIDIELMYKTMDEDLITPSGNATYHGGGPKINEKDARQRAIFISSVFLHEYLHTFQGKTLLDQTHPYMRFREAACWAAQYWYIRNVGGHAWLEKHARKQFKDEYAAKKAFEALLGQLNDRTPRLTNHEILENMFAA